MPKLPFRPLSLGAALLAACSTPAVSAPDEHPAPSPSASPSTSPIATPKPAPKPTPTPAPAPEVAPPAPTPVPAPVPAAPQPAPFIPESPQPVVPVAPADPAVAPLPVHVPPALPHTAWTYPDLAPVPGPEPVRVERVAGTYWNVVGDGYPPGAEIGIMFGKWQTDTDLLDIPTVHADANGHYSVQIHLSADFTPGTYGFMVWYKPFSEEGKRHAIVEVLPPGTGMPTP